MQSLVRRAFIYASASVTGQPLCITAIEDGTITYTFGASQDYGTKEVEYSLNGKNWTKQLWSSRGKVNVNVYAGQSVYWRAKSGTKRDLDNNPRFSSTCKFTLSGNIMSMVWGISYKNMTSLKYTCAFNGLFQGSKVVSCKDLIVPVLSWDDGYGSSTAATYRYYGCELRQLFMNCVYLEDASFTLPASYVSGSGYRYMFYGCTALTKPPQILAIKAGGNAFSEMFQGCTSLITAPEIKAKPAQMPAFFEGSTPGVTTNVFLDMFNGCSNLAEIKTAYLDTTQAGKWVKDVAANGKMIVPSSYQGTVENYRGVNGIPQGWSVEFY